MNIFTEYNPTIPTVLCEIMGRNKSDKGSPQNNGWHNYTTYYHSLFFPVRSKCLRIFELGLGTNNITIKSNMGSDGTPGASLRGWKEYFSSGEIFGADIDAEILFQEERIKTFWCDQTSPEAIFRMWNNSELLENFDIIIEDGLHTFEANKCFFENSIHKLKTGGVYIVEDIKLSDINRFQHQINEWKETYSDLMFRIVNIPHRNNCHDNCILAITKS